MTAILKIRPGVLLLVIALMACGTGSTGTNSTGVRMQRTYTGGRACSGGGHYEKALQRIKESFRQRGLTPIQEKIRGRVVCQACSCPAYSFDHLIRISRKQAAIARSLGYQVATNAQR